MIPSNAECYFEEGDKLCCVRGNFVNLQESPAGFGTTYAEAYQALVRDEADERKRFERHLRAASRMVKAMPLWKQNVLRAALENKSTVDPPRKPVNNNDDDGGF